MLMKKLLLLPLLAGFALQGMAQTFSVDGISYTVINGTTNVMTAAGKSYDSPGNKLGKSGTLNLEIPQTVKNDGVTYTVTEIGDYSFSDYNYDNTSIKTVELPSTITRIGANAFCYAPITQVTIHATTPPELGTGPFSNISQKFLLVPQSAIAAYEAVSYFSSWTINAIGGGAVNPQFEYEGIKYTITDMDKKTLETRADTGLYLDERDGNGSGGSSYSDYMANNNVSGDVVIPATIEYEGETYTVTSIGEGSFFFGDITSITLPSTVIEIQDLAFCYCMDLTSIKMSENLEVIGDYAFDYVSIKEAILPPKVEYIGAYAFVWCDSMEKAEIPAAVTSLQEGTFYGCTELVSFTSHATTAPTLEVETTLVFSEVTKELCTLYIPKGSLGSYSVSDNYQWGYYFSDILEIDMAGVEGIENDLDYPVEYYNLQGVKVSNPETGRIYIQRQGKTVKKVLVR